MSKRLAESSGCLESADAMLTVVRKDFVREFGIEPDNDERRLFFLKDDKSAPGTHNLVEIYSEGKERLTTKSFYKTRKDATQRAMSLKKSPHFTSVTEGAILSKAKLPKFFEYPAIEGENNDEMYFRDGDMSLEGAVGDFG